MHQLLKMYILGKVADRNVCPTNANPCLQSKVYRLLSAVALLLAAAGCAAFSRQPEVPEEAMRRAATAIERAVLEGADSEIAFEDQPEFKGAAREVERAVRSRQSRIGVVGEFKQKGYVGENARGLLKYVKNSECQKDSRLHTRVANVILSDNGDRWRIYETLARENHLSGSGRKRIQTIFHEVRIELARPGDLLQLTDGAAWTKKTVAVESAVE